MKKPTIGFIGAGLMGHGMAKNILSSGYSLVVVAHRNRGPIDDLLRRGAVEAVDIGEIAREVDILFLCVTSSVVVASLVEGDRGIAIKGQPGLIVADASTGDPATTIRLGARLAERGIYLVDAPLARTPREAEEGKLNMLLSGDPNAVSRVREVALTFCENIFEVGVLGSAIKLKLVNNILSLGHAVLAAEAINAAQAAGVDLGNLYNVVSHGGANSAAFEIIVSSLLRGNDKGMQFSIRNARKDLRCYSRMMEATDTINLLSQGIYDVYNLATALGHGDDMISQLAQVVSAGGLRK
jgi:3-hydroxyisobutyrate dehydrogenase-like beta-hydroxyacid dehydrogenase